MVDMDLSSFVGTETGSGVVARKNGKERFRATYWTGERTPGPGPALYKSQSGQHIGPFRHSEVIAISRITTALAHGKTIGKMEQGNQL